MTREVVAVGSAGYVSALSVFIENSINEMSVWLFVMFWVIVADLAAAGYKVYKDPCLKFRFSKAIRDTLAKMVVYYAVVVASVFTGASLGMTQVAYWACSLIYLAEGISVFGNILKAHGYTLNVKAVIKLIASMFKAPEDIVKPIDE